MMKTLEVFLYALISLATSCDIRLSVQKDSETELSGVPQVRTNTSWMSICARNTININTLCQELGYEEDGSIGSELSNSTNTNSIEVYCNASDRSVCQCEFYDGQVCRPLLISCHKGIASDTHTVLLYQLVLSSGLPLMFLVILILIVLVIITILIRQRTRNLYNVERTVQRTVSSQQEAPAQHVIQETNLNTMEKGESDSLPQYVAVRNISHFINKNNFDLFVEDCCLSDCATDDEEAPLPELPERRYLKDSYRSSCSMSSTSSLSQEGSESDKMPMENELQQDSNYMRLDLKKCEPSEDNPYMSLNSSTKKVKVQYEEISNYMTLTPTTMTRQTIRQSCLPVDVKIKALKKSKKDGPYTECNPASKE